MLPLIRVEAVRGLTGSDEYIFPMMLRGGAMLAPSPLSCLQSPDFLKVCTYAFKVALRQVNYR